jgi:hypothetical protein
MNSSSSIDNEQLASLKSAYLEAFRDFNEHRTEDAFSKFRASVYAYMSFNTEEAFSKLRASVDAYMSFIEIDEPY